MAGHTFRLGILFEFSSCFCCFFLFLTFIHIFIHLFVFFFFFFFFFGLMQFVSFKINYKLMKQIPTHQYLREGWSILHPPSTTLAGWPVIPPKGA